MYKIRIPEQLALLLMPVGFAALALAVLLIGLHARPAQARAPAVSSLIWPISGSSQPDSDLISSPFGPRWQASQQRYDFHPGLDIVAPLGTPVHVITDGLVTTVGWLTPSSGLTVIVSHTLAGYYSAYLHLDSTQVTVTQPVNQGDIIGYVGDSGDTNFVHLHFEIRVDPHGYPANTRNPMGYLPHPDLSPPTIQITSLSSYPVFSPTVTLFITTTREELDLNQLRVILQDRSTGAVLDDQLVDFNLRLHTGQDNLDQDGIRLTPALFNTASHEYQLGAYFYQLTGMDAFTLTATAVDLAGQSTSVVTTGDDSTPPDRVRDLHLQPVGNGLYTLIWIAPGDSGNIGTADSYEFRFYDQPLNEANWLLATVLLHPPAPLPAGSIQSWDVPGEWKSGQFVAMRAKDPEGNISPISNSAGDHWMLFIPMVTH